MPTTRRSSSSPSSSSAYSSLSSDAASPESPSLKDDNTVRVPKVRTFDIGDTVLIRSGKDAPYIGKVLKIKGVAVTVEWFYRPEDIKGGRREYHGKDELLRSDHTDDVHIKTVFDECVVFFSVDEYKEMRDQLEDPVMDFFIAREFYDCVAEKITTPLENICVCRTPENPDVSPVQCKACEKQFHVGCVDVPKKGAFVCPGGCKTKRKREEE